MGGTGSGRKSVKFEAVKCLIDVQLGLWELLNDFDDKVVSREELKERLRSIYKRTKVAQEEVERL